MSACLRDRIYNVTHKTLPHSLSTFQAGDLEMKILEGSLPNMKTGTCKHGFGFHFNLNFIANVYTCFWLKQS